MRHVGTCFEVIGMRPHDHIGWVFDGPEDFEALARRFLAEGIAHREQLMFVAPDPDPEAMVDLVDPIFGQPVQVASIAEVYGASGHVDPGAQRATFASALAEAISAGYTGIRVAADNTPLVVDDDRRAAWMRWECVADHFMSENPVIGMCAFDRRQVAIDNLRHLATLHPLSSASAPTAQFQLFVDDEALWVRGLLDTYAVGEIAHALQALPKKTPLVVDLTDVTLMSQGVMAELAGLSQRGTPVTIQGRPEDVESVERQMRTRPDRLRFLALSA